MTRRSGEFVSPFMPSFDYGLDAQDVADAQSFSQHKVLVPFTERTTEAEDVCVIIDDAGACHREAMEILYKSDGRPKHIISPDVLSFPWAHLCIHPGSPRKSVFTSPGAIGEYVASHVRPRGFSRVTIVGLNRPGGFTLLQTVFLMVYTKVWLKETHAKLKVLSLLSFYIRQRGYHSLFNVRRGDKVKKNGGSGNGGGWFVWRQIEANRGRIIWPQGVAIAETTK